MAEGTPVHAVITAVAEVTDSDPTELPPLSKAIDPEAPNTFFDSSSLSQLRM
ncbi:HalOD1 output domain-containing protein [Haloterrigena turkmenica]|uniref:HalOD1 output domain-containing protein n=1 Tax=Haloterrigena turkmenica TaxID=62320 RepID=UPI001650DCFB|nr:HalOD1 output domain-containing protein [Haloterrigena turkmenica]